MKVVYKENDGIKCLEFAIDWVKQFGIELLAKNNVPSGFDYWFVTDEELLTLENIPIEAWEIEGEPDGKGGLSENELPIWKNKLDIFQRNTVEEENDTNKQIETATDSE